MLDAKQQQIMSYLHEHVFDPVLISPTASDSLKSGIRLTIMRMEKLEARKMVQYFWSAIIGTERSIGFAARMREEGFTRFEEVFEEVRVRFDDRFMRR